MMPTIKDVAEKAGVGIATVSRAMNGTGYVSARSREKIEAAIRELNYIPNERARNLSRKQTGIIGVLIPDFQTPFYASFLRQIEIELYNYGYRTMVCNTVKHSDREATYVEMLDRNMVDGLITSAWSAEAEVYRNLDKPVVSMDHDLGDDIPLIHSDHKNGGRIAAEHLLEKHCKRVLQLGSYFSVHTPSNDRYREFQRIMNEAGVEVRQLDPEWNRLDYEYYEKYLLEHLRDVKWADAVFASDMGAIACYRFATERGILVPDQMKIMAYDGTDFTRMTMPVMTAVRQDVAKLAAACADTMMQLIQHKESICMHQIIDVEFQNGGTI